jgi:hypothetical protein
MKKTDHDEKHSNCGRIDPALRRAVARTVKRHRTTGTALVEASLAQYRGAARPAKALAHTAPPTATTESR